MTDFKPDVKRALNLLPNSAARIDWGFADVEQGDRPQARVIYDMALDQISETSERIQFEAAVPVMVATTPTRTGACDTLFPQW